jgi:hypothetical protein
MKTFEKYLEEEVWEPEGVLDDDMPDAFEAWICDLDVAEVMDYVEEWGKSLIERRILDIETIIACKLPYDGECLEDLEKLFNSKK